MGSVRSAKLAHLNVTSGAVKLFTSPATKTVAITMVIIGNVSGTPIVANLEVGKPTVGSSHAVIWQEAIAANTIFRLATHIVMPAGDECWAFLTGAGTGRYNLYGFEYDGVAPDFP